MEKPETSSIGKVISIIISTFIVGCAGQYPPSGGPVDTTPPKIVYSEPAQNAINFHQNRVLLEFSEYVDQRSVQDAIFFSPNLGDLEYEWSGTEVEIKFPQKLRENTTYVLSVGTDVKDWRAGNKMKESYALAFSSGDSIDSCSIVGRVFDSKPSGISIFAYNLNDRDPDTLDIKKLKPDYTTQTGDNGFFSLPFLAFGRYRIFAVRDEYKNFLYDPQVDQYGVFNQDISLSTDSLHISDLKFRMAIEDTLAPFIDAVTVVDKNKLHVRFSEQIDTSDIKSLKLSICDTTRMDSLQGKNVCLLGSENKLLSVLTSDQDTLTYRLTISGIKDTAGNLISAKHSQFVFQGSNVPDTIKPIISFINIKDSIKDIPYPFIFNLGFSEPINKEKFQRGFSIFDSNKTKVNGEFIWHSDALVSFSPSEKLQSMMWYRVSVAMDSIFDYSGNSMKDSTLIIKFRTIDKKKLSEIRGLVRSGPIDSLNANAIVEIKKLNSITKFSKKLVFKKQGEFVFEDLEEGQYVLDAFLSKNGNGLYDYGKVFPYKPSEKFVLYPDTVKVRARWPVEGIILKFEK
jgi:hypothetical protein